MVVIAVSVVSGFSRTLDGRPCVSKRGAKSDGWANEERPQAQVGAEAAAVRRGPGNPVEPYLRNDADVRADAHSQVRSSCDAEGVTADRRLSAIRAVDAGGRESRTDLIRRSSKRVLTHVTASHYELGTDRPCVSAMKMEQS